MIAIAEGDVLRGGLDQSKRLSGESSEQTRLAGAQGPKEEDVGEEECGLTLEGCFLVGLDGN